MFSVLADAFGYFLLFATIAALVAARPAPALADAPRACRGVLAYLALCLVNYGFVYYGQWRYRLPMEPFMIVVAAPLLVRLWAQRGACHALARLARKLDLSVDLAAPPSGRRRGADLRAAGRGAVRAGAAARAHALGVRLPLVLGAVGRASARRTSRSWDRTSSWSTRRPSRSSGSSTRATGCPTSRSGTPTSRSGARTSRTASRRCCRRSACRPTCCRSGGRSA